MRLLHLAAVGFRNLQDLDLPVDASFVVLSGANAQGKTNALEAIYLLATLKPLRARRNRELVRFGAEQASVACRVEAGGVQRRFRVDLTSKGRQVRLDGKRPAELSDYFAGVRAIAFTPSDAEIVSGSPEVRRNWIDRAAFTRAPQHLDVVRTYRRAQAQKSAALRSARPEAAVLDVLDDRLAVLGGRLTARRASMLAELEPHVASLHQAIAGQGAAVQLRYRGVGDALDEASVIDTLRRALAAARPDELRRRTCLVGPQRHDVGLSIDGHEARTYGSRGQIRSLVLALKLAELVAARERGEVPLFLLDDLSSELDRARTGRLVGLLRDLGAQVFITTTDPGHLQSLPAGDTLSVSVLGGRLSPQERLQNDA